MGFFKAKKRQIALQFSTLGEVMIDGLPFSFGVESIGKASNQGICVTIAGEGVESGNVTFSDLEFHETHGGKVTIVKMEFPLVKKNDGKNLYRAKFTKIPITEYANSKGILPAKVTEQSVIDRLNAEISFKVTPHFKKKEPEEILLTVFPVENPLGGLCNEWINVTSDRDYFLHKIQRGKNN